jgi:CxxC-x17-CxxC domain-containing protein
MKYDRGSERKMYPIVCADCGKEAEVPFKPDGDRPVYCRDCYQKHRPQRDKY